MSKTALTSLLVVALLGLSAATASAFEPVNVPEPGSTLLLLGLGLAGLGALKSWRR